jgi:cytochrome c oxidase subunit 3
MNLFRRMTEKPWLQPDGASVVELSVSGGATSGPAARMALRLFLAIVTVLFSLFTVSYFVRMGLPDWRPLPEPSLLWGNTALLLAASIVLQCTRMATERGHDRWVRIGVVVGGVLSIGFLLGQLAAWQQLEGRGYYLASNPANSFFYVITALHGLHLVGGLVVWIRTAMRVLSGAELYRVRLSVELCTVYWHFLLLVWLAMFWLLIST